MIQYNICTHYLQYIRTQMYAHVKRNILTHESTHKWRAIHAQVEWSTYTHECIHTWQQRSRYTHESWDAIQYTCESMIQYNTCTCDEQHSRYTRESWHAIHYTRESMIQYNLCTCAMQCGRHTHERKAAVWWLTLMHWRVITQGILCNTFQYCQITHTHIFND